MNNAHCKLVLLALTALVCYSLPFLFSDEAVSPDDLTYSFFSSHLARTGNPGYRPPGDEIFGVAGFIPRYFAYNRRGETLPRQFPGFILFWAGLKRLLPLRLARFVNPLCGILALLFLFFIGRLLSPDPEESLWAAVLLATTPVFVHRTYAYTPTLFNLTLFLASLYFLLSALYERASLSYLLFGLCAGFFLWIRPTNAVYLLSMFILVYLERKRVKGIFLAISVLLIAAFGAGLLAYNHRFYGGFFNLGYTAATQPPETASGSKLPLSIREFADYLRFHPKIWLLHLKNAPLTLGLGFPLLVPALIGFLAGRQEEKQNRFRLFSLWLFLISLLFFSNFGTSGYERNELTLHSSFLRHLMPAIGLLPIFAVRAVSRLPSLSGRLLTIMSAVNIIFSLATPSGVIETVMQNKYYQHCRRFLLRQSDSDSVIFSFYWDKLVFPERLVYTNGSPAPSDGIGQVIDRVYRKGYRVIYPSSPSDRVVGEILTGRYEVEETEGPSPLPPLVRLATRFIPDNLYPLRIYEVTGRKPENRQ